MILMRNGLKIGDIRPKTDAGAPSKLTQEYKNRQKSIAERLAYLQGQDIKVEIPSVEFTDEELLSWVDNFDLFCKQCLQIEMQEVSDTSRTEIWQTQTPILKD